MWDDTLKFAPGSRVDGMPSIGVYFLDNGEAPRGIGETATSCVMATLTNATLVATGKRIRNLAVANRTGTR